MVMKLIFKFQGGPLDGKTVIGRPGHQDEADRYYSLSNHGRPGQRFRIASEYAVGILSEEVLQDDRPRHFQQHVYQVADRFEDQEKIFVRAVYVQGETAN